MKVNRLDWTRVLKSVKSTGVNAVKFDAEGQFSVSSNGIVLYGNGVKTGQAVGLLDIDILMKMLNSFVDPEISVEVSAERLVLSNAQVFFSYRLGAPELIEGCDTSLRDKLEKVGKWHTKILTNEDLSRIVSLVRSLGLGKVSFLTSKGKLVFSVGSEKLFSGTMVLTEMDDLPGNKEFVFLTPKLLAVFDVIDEGKFELGFARSDDGDVAMLRITEKDFVWYLGVLSETKEEKTK